MTVRPHTLLRRLGLLCSGLLLLAALPASAAVVSDDFDDNLLNEGVWERTQGGSGPVADEQEQRLEVRLPAASAGELFFAGAQIKSLFRGDLDVQVDFQALEYPLQNGVRMGIVVEYAGGAFTSVQRTRVGQQEEGSEPRDGYVFDNGGTVSRHPSAALAGKLRLTRVGTVVTGYYWEAETAAWVPFASGTGPTEDVRIALSVWSHDDAFEDQEVRVAFDNVVVNKGQWLGPALPDLTAQWLQSRQRTRGRGENQRSTVQGKFAVQNVGGSTAGPSVVRFYLSADNVLSPEDLLLQQSTVRTLRPRAKQMVWLKQKLPPGVSAGGQFVIAVVDADSAVAEADEFASSLASAPLRQAERRNSLTTFAARWLGTEPPGG